MEYGTVVSTVKRRPGRMVTSGLAEPPEFVLDSLRSSVEESFVEGGGFATNAAGCQLVLHQDSWSGRYFESLTDATIYFLPSKLHAYSNRIHTPPSLFPQSVWMGQEKSSSVSTYDEDG